MVIEIFTSKLEKKDSVYKKHQKVLLDYSQNYRTIFQYSLMALFMVMQRDFDYNQQPAQPGTRDSGNPASGNHSTEVKDFSQNIETEMLTEK